MKTALITGSTKGIGKQIGLDLLSKGYTVYFNYANDDKTARLLDFELKDLGFNKFKIIKADLSDIEEIDKLNKQINILGLDILVLNAGITDRTKFGKVSLYNWNKVFNMNLTIPFFLVQELKDKIKFNGKIIFISSISGCTTDSTSIAYGVSKAAIHMLVPYLAKEFANKKITVNAIAPGYTDTKWHRHKSKAQIKRIEKKHLVNRLGTTKEISKAVMAVIENDFINAQTIRVDGGFGLL